MEHSVRYILAKGINRIIPKKKNSIFAEPHMNGKSDCQDMINYSGDSVLTFLNYLINNGYLSKVTLYLVIYDDIRIEAIKEYLEKKDINSVKLILHYSYYSGIKKTIKKVQYILLKMSTIIWLCATVHANKRFAVKAQKLICLGYFSSFKSNYNDLPFEYLPKNWTLVCSTSAFDSTIKSAAYAIPYNQMQPLGLARNDYLFSDSNKDIEIRKWIQEKTGKNYSKLVLYAPTFRDYEKAETHKRNIWGYTSNDEINKALKESDALVIAKLHSWQNKDVIMGEMDNLIVFEPNYSFTVYDVMKIADLMITDYSSIGLDFMLMKKPVIYNLYDKEKYIKTRGMCMEPISVIYGGDIAETEKELSIAILKCLKDRYISTKMESTISLFFKYKDGNTCERVYKYLCEKKVF